MEASPCTGLHVTHPTVCKHDYSSPGDYTHICHQRKFSASTAMGTEILGEPGVIEKQADDFEVAFPRPLVKSHGNLSVHHWKLPL